jgi:hypothetical protein
MIGSLRPSLRRSSGDFGRDDTLAKGDCSVRKLLQIRCSENEPLYFTTSGFRPGNGAETN